MELDVLGTPVQIDESHIQAESATIREQIQEYCDRERKRFDLRFRMPEGFLGQAMEAMATIPYGETRTYGQLADELDTAAVAVGQACGRNPVPVIVPCHRVVARDGIGGYQYPDLKGRLLELEEKNSNGS
jgi:methylated-DNA-[protein]-cysteine S-methyltransferase